jgi:hypothetical protein
MPQEQPPEFLWFLRMDRELAKRYQFRWIAVDRRAVREDPDSIDAVVVGDGDTLAEAADIARLRSGATDFDPLMFYYAFVYPPLDTIERQMAAAVTT